jgi:hypothetical protein
MCVEALGVLGLVDHAHAAAEFLDNAVCEMVWPMSWEDVVTGWNGRSDAEGGSMANAARCC